MNALHVANTQGVHRNVYCPDFQLTYTCIKYKPNTNIHLPRAESLLKMKRLAEKLAKPFKAARIDLYCIDDVIYFGEITFYHASGYQKLSPREFAHSAGDNIKVKMSGG